MSGWNKIVSPVEIKPNIKQMLTVYQHVRACLLACVRAYVRACVHAFACLCSFFLSS